jgi:hypothetical protein
MLDEGKSAQRALELVKLALTRSWSLGFPREDWPNIKQRWDFGRRVVEGSA